MLNLLWFYSTSLWPLLCVSLFPTFRLENNSVQFSHSVMCDSLWPHGLQHARLPCPSPSPGVCSDSCPLSWWCHPTISSSVVPFSSCLQFFPASGSFPNESVLCIRCSKYWSFSISPSKEYSGLISFRMDRLNLLAVQGICRYVYIKDFEMRRLPWLTQVDPKCNHKDP